MFGIPIMIIRKRPSLRNQFRTKTESDYIIVMNRHQAMKRCLWKSFNIRIVQKQSFRNAVRNFIITIERELLAEVVGETKVCVTVHAQDFEEEWSFNNESSSHGHGGGHGREREEAKGQGPGHDHPKGKDTSPF